MLWRGFCDSTAGSLSTLELEDIMIDSEFFGYCLSVFTLKITPFKYQITRSLVFSSRDLR